MGLVVEIGPDHGRIAAVAGGQHGPVVDPALLRNLAGVPQLTLTGGCGPVAVENDFEAAFTSALNEYIHDLQPGEALEIGILLKVDSIRETRRVEQLVAVGQANGVEPRLDHLIEHIVQAARPEPLGGERAGLEAEPIDAADVHHAPIGVDDVAAVGPQWAAAGLVSGDAGSSRGARAGRVGDHGSHSRASRGRVDDDGGRAARLGTARRRGATGQREKRRCKQARRGDAENGSEA